ncbi:hypothetical protein GGI09_006107 [Coemansia sp. S100]|nr:hypothetical protein GGI09_006107 [Coemansia sp. S100]
MKITTAFIALAAIIGVGVDAQGVCGSNVIRKEVRRLTPAEWNSVSSVARSMNDAGWFGWFAYLHNQYFNVIHGNEFFFPWHRRFIRDFEIVGQTYDRNFALPYWDELRDFANPAASEVLSAKFLGTNGRDDRCVRDGNQAGWTLTYPDRHCLRRQYNAGARINAWYSPEFIQSILSRSTRMSQLRPGIEFSLHGAIHIAMGGDMVQNHSPNDFVFWIHHANIDRIWAVWQMMNPNQNYWSMDGFDSANRPMQLGTPVPHYNDLAGDTVQLGMKKMCYFYDNGNTITNRRRSLLERRGETKKCIPRPIVSLPPLPPLVEGVFNNVNALPVPADTYVQATISQKLPPVVLDKWFPSFTGGAAPNVTTGGAPNVAIPKAPDFQVDIPSAPYIPGSIPHPPVYSAVPPPYSYSAVPTHNGYSTIASDSASDGYSAVDPGSSDYSSGSSTNGGYSAIDYSSSPGSSSIYGSSSNSGSSSGSDSYSTSDEDGESASSGSSSYGSSSSGSSSGVYIPSPLPSGSDSLYNSSAASSSSSSSSSAAYSAVYTEEYHAFDPVDVSKGLKYPMPNPFPMTEHFVKMHNYPVAEIHKQYLLAREFVVDMNAAGYQSPFAKGATA